MIVTVPKTTTETTVLTTDVTQTKRIEVEIQESTMTQKPKQIEMVIPKTKISTTDIEMTIPAPQVQAMRPVDEQIEETRPTIEVSTKDVPTKDKPLEKEQIDIEIKAKPLRQDVVMEISTTPMVPEETSPVEAEVPAPTQSMEVEERETITVKPTPELETRAPEQEVEISERDTIEIVKIPDEEQTFEIEIDVQDTTAPTVTETVQIDTVTKETIIEHVLPEVSETHKEEITLDIAGKPMDTVQLMVEVQPSEKQVPQNEEIKEVETLTETVTESFQLPEMEEIPQTDVPVETQEKPLEEFQMTIDIKELETPETEEITSTEKIEVTETTTVTVPMVIETTKEELTVDVQDSPLEKVSIDIELQKGKEVPEIEEVTSIEKTDITETITFEIPEVTDTRREEVIMEFADKLAEEVTKTIEIPKEKEVPVTKETTHVETIEVTREIISEVPEVKEKHTEDIIIETQEKPHEGVTFEIEIKQKEVPETTEITQLDVTTKTFTETIELPTVEETFTDEVTLDISKKPETVQMDIDVPTTEVSTEEVTLTLSEVTEEAPEDVKETEMHKEEIQLDIKGKPKEQTGMEIILPLQLKESPKETSPKDTSPKQESPLMAPTTEEIFETFETVEEGSPEFTWGLTSLKVMDGEEAKFFCELRAEPIPEVAWFHDEKPIGENQDFR